jgi:hypothetical protein
MHDEATDRELPDSDLRERLSLIETMIAEGRRTTESWGWTFVLWGAAYFIAIAWTAWGSSGKVFAWPVTMIAATIVTVIAVSKQAGGRPETTLGRAVLSIWIALGITMFVLFLGLSLGGFLGDLRVFVAVASGILGLANGASGLILRWKVQLACAAAWWAAAAAACFLTADQSIVVFLIAIFLCQIVFGIYGMVAEAREKKQRRGALHA